MKTYLSLFAVLAILCSCNSNPPLKTSAASATNGMDSLRSRLTAMLNTKKADVGVAVLGLEDGDTLSINGHKDYALMSVAKFPQALLLLHLVDSGKISMAEPLRFSNADLQQRTASSLRKDHPGESIELIIPEALRYSIGQSDNITSNKIFGIEGGPKAVEAYVHKTGVNEIAIFTDYAHMGTDSLHRNWGSPTALVQLLEKFYQQHLLSDSSQRLLWKTMVEGTSGPNRLKGQLPPGTEVGHKTGSSGKDDSTGITMATNDVGIVTLPNGKHFAIAVFVANSSETEDANAAIIASVCKQVWDYFIAKSK